MAGQLPGALHGQVVFVLVVDRVSFDEDTTLHDRFPAEDLFGIDASDIWCVHTIEGFSDGPVRLAISGVTRCQDARLVVAAPRFVEVVVWDTPARLRDLVDEKDRPRSRRSGNSLDR